MSLDEVRAFVPRLAAVCHALAALPFPTIAAVSAAPPRAEGASWRWPATCASCPTTRGSACARPRWRSSPAPAAPCRLPRIAGMAVAKRWIFTARMFTADEAKATASPTRSCPVDRLDDEAVALAETIAANGPVAVRLAKRSIEGGFDLSMRRSPGPRVAVLRRRARNRPTARKR